MFVSGKPSQPLGGPDEMRSSRITGSIAFGFKVIFEVIAIQIRNNDLLMDIRDEQRELNGTMREFLRLAREDTDAS